MGFYDNVVWYLKRKRRKANVRAGGYSQYGQDVVVMELLGHPAHGVFVDIGANDGVSFSNSLLFEQQGWTGICIEPNPVIYESLAKNRACNLVNACIAGEDSNVTFLVVEGSGNMLSGIREFCDAHHLNRIDKEIRKNGGGTRTIEIEALSPATLLSRYDVREIDYLSIDTEGCEMEILKRFDFTKVPTKVIGVENSTRSPVFANYLAIYGYRLAKCVGCDEIYVHSSISL